MNRWILVVLVLFAAAWSSALPAANSELRSLQPDEVLSKIDRSVPGFERVRQALEKDDCSRALGELLAYYREKHPLAAAGAKADRGQFETADRIVEHIFQWGPYEPADYGDEIDWEWDPRGDIEWVAAIYRFYWAPPLAEAYRATRDEKYVRAFVELTSDWIAKHPLENRQRAHPVYTGWRGFAWLDIQTGIRADNLCKVFPVMVHGSAFTPEFLGVFLSSLYDHQVKTERLPMGKVHNKAIFEQRGFANVAATFPEFKDSRRWMELAVERTAESFLAQTTTDGVQREWSFGYNLGVLRDAVDIMRRAEAAGVAVPEEYRQRVRAMYDYLAAVATPELAGPMFGDASRSETTARDRSGLPLYDWLIEATELLADAKYAARAKLDQARLPAQTSYAFSRAGIYVFRDRWGPEQVYLALHCSPPAISGHDQPDNGTFELCAFGRWLMPDTGFYTYGHDAAARAWHRRTRVHQTLTLDGRDSRVDGRELLWHMSPQVDALVVENAAYPGLVHRRTVWFVDKRLFVLVDEALGDAEGTLELHFQLAHGEARIDPEAHWAGTRFDDANVLVWADPSAAVTMQDEEGWYAWKYGHRKPRPAFCYRHADQAPALFLTLLVPFRGTDRPTVHATLGSNFRAGSDLLEVDVSAFGQSWSVGRDLRNGTAWCRGIDGE